MLQRATPLSASPQPAPGGWRSRVAYLLPWLVLAAILSATHHLWRNAQHDALQALQTQFDYRERDAVDKVEKRMKAYEQVMRGVDGLFAHARIVGRGEFRDYVARLRLEESYPGIQGLCFAEIIPPEQKNRHIAAVRKEGFPGYAIRPEGERDIYTSAVYLEPFSGRNLRAFGFDNYTDAVRRAAMEQARDSGQAAISGKVALLHEDKDNLQAGFRMYLPVYRHGAARDTLAARRANIIGWIYAPFSMDDLMGGILGERSVDVDIEIYDGEELSDRSLIYDADGFRRAASSGSPDARFRAIRRIRADGHAWTILTYSQPGFEAQLDESKPRLIALGGAVTGVLLALLTWLLAHGRERALQEARNMNRELIEREDRLRLAATVFDAVDEAVMVTGPDNRIVAVNPSFTRITGYPASEAIGNDPRMLSSGKHGPEFFRELWTTLAAGGGWQGEIWNRRKNGELYIEWLSINFVYDEQGRPAYHVAVFSDISERKAAEERIHRMAHYDLLTNLPNRVLLTDRLLQAITQAKRDRACMALMFLDLDKFKPVNDTHGHNVGDLLLIEVAKRLQECVRGSDTVARIGGDEFVVLLPHLEAGRDALPVAEKMLHSLRQPFAVASLSLHISSSIGIAVYPDHGSDGEQLMKNADAAMYLAKEDGHNIAVFFRPETA
ncbi:MAG: CHASE domain-containing protein [Nitrosomonadales bacterium]|nr:CHASE domain-containing protein [Nitrosomonadales bacterium]